MAIRPAVAGARLIRITLYRTPPYLHATRHTLRVRAALSRGASYPLGAPALAPLPAGRASRASESALARIVAATMCRLEASASVGVNK